MFKLFFLLWGRSHWERSSLCAIWLNFEISRGLDWKANGASEGTWFASLGDDWNDWKTPRRWWIGWIDERKIEWKHGCLERRKGKKANWMNIEIMLRKIWKQASRVNLKNGERKWRRQKLRKICQIMKLLWWSSVKCPVKKLKNLSWTRRKKKKIPRNQTNLYRFIPTVVEFIDFRDMVSGQVQLPSVLVF